jgi:serine/threonine protein kinase
MLYLHTRAPPIIHRDIKSHNIFITEPTPGHYVAKIGDWGSARAVALTGAKSMTQVHIHTCLYLCERIYVYIYLWIQVHLHYGSTRAVALTGAKSKTQVHIYTYMFVPLWTYTCIYVYIYLWIQVHLHYGSARAVALTGALIMTQVNV